MGQKTLVEIPYKKLKKSACLEIFKMIRRLNFWQTKLNGEPWINRIPYLLEGIKNGNYFVDK